MYSEFWKQQPIIKQSEPSEDSVVYVKNDFECLKRNEKVTTFI